MILTQEKFKKGGCWHGFGVLYFYGQNGPNFANFFPSTTLQVPNFTNSKKRYLKGVPLDFTQKG